MPYNVVAQNNPQNPYREFTRTLAAGERYRLNYATNYFRVLSLTANTLSINFYGTGDTSIVGAGMGIKLPDVLPWVDLINTGAGNITLTVAVGIGEFIDNRLTVSGNINTVPVGGGHYTTVADVAVLTHATTKVLAAAAGTQTAIISNLAANNTVIRVGDASTGVAQGTEVPVGSTVTLDTAADIYVYNPSGGTINIGVSYIGA